MVTLIADKLRNNDGLFFKKFTRVRKLVEKFLIENKAIITMSLQNMSKTERTPKMRDLFDFLVGKYQDNEQVQPEDAIAQMGFQGRILDVRTMAMTSHISDDTKSLLFVKEAINSALKCPLCGGLLDPTKSVSYDHITPVRDGGMGDVTNTQLAHPYCNTGFKESLAAEKPNGV